jgi:hypothetical protein
VSVSIPSHPRIENPVAVLASSVLVGVAIFVAVLLGVARLGRVVTHTLDGLVTWIPITFAVAITCAVGAFLLVWRQLNKTK